MDGGQDLPVLDLAFFIVDWKKIKTISTIFSQNNTRYQFVCKGRGTANSEILDILGIGSTDKAVILCLEQNTFAPRLLREVGQKLGLNHPGTGIGFSIPLSAVNNLVLDFLIRSGMTVDKNVCPVPEVYPKVYQGEERRKMERKYDLIVSILNQGYSDEFMTVAREAGAGGGTVINARGLVKSGPAKIFGISIQNEKEIIIILTTRAKKAAIMEAVSKSHGMASKAEGIVFSVPADNITGIDLR
ncbi:MAG: hypothetical protein LBF80_04615 [Spirochaetaceae bacterium]|jgi:hypothetical protein|nr:hypothetical protein [Spirochaetaceae bacterium]